MIDVIPLLVSLFMATACPECEAANARNMNDIAATPSGNDGADSDSGPARVAATRWGAIATADGTMGVAEMFGSQEAAELKALRDCRDNLPGAPCRILVSYYNQCAAVAWGDRGSVWARGPDLREIESEVMASCDKTQTNCDIYYSSCSYPE